MGLPGLTVSGFRGLGFRGSIPSLGHWHGSVLLAYARNSKLSAAMPM